MGLFENAQPVELISTCFFGPGTAFVVGTLVDHA
jgi:hypothetical protein